MSEIRVAGKVKDSIVDGPGLRYTLFTQGCPHNCKGCHNPETHNFNGGKVENSEDIFEDILLDKGIRGVTFSGGDPFLQAEKLLPLAKQIKEYGFELAAYSGWTFEQLYSNCVPCSRELLNYIDVLIDGKFILEQKSLELSFRGSKNQRIVNVPKSLKNGYAIISDDKDWLGKEYIDKADPFAPKNIKEMGK